MRCLYFFPLAYICGVHGFMIFAPYVAVAVTALAVARRLRLA